MLLRAVDGIIIYLLSFNTDLSTILPTLNYSEATKMDYALSTIDSQRLATPKLRVKTELLQYSRWCYNLSGMPAFDTDLSTMNSQLWAMATIIRTDVKTA